MDNPDECETILITDSEHSSDEAYDDVFVIQEQLTKISRERHDRIYALISDIDIGSDFDMPFFDIVWRHITATRHGRFNELLLFGLRLESYLDDRSPERIVCSSEMNRGYQAVVRDIANNSHITVSALDPSATRYHRLRRWALSTVLMLPFLFDQILSLLFFSVRKPPAATETAFVPSLGRLSSILPVIDRAEFDHEIIISANASSLWWIIQDSMLTNHTPVPVSAYTSVSCLRDQMAVYKKLVWNVFFGNDLANEMTKEVKKSLNIRLPNTVEYSVIRAFKTRLCISVLLYVLYRQFTDHIECEKVVTGGLDPSGRALVCAGIDADVTTYHIPHGTASMEVPNPPSDLISLISGSVDKRHYTESPQVVEPWTCVETGRPYLTRLYDRKTETDSDPSEKLRFLIATQPLRGEQSFVRNTVAAITEAVPESEVIVKIHPSEKRKKYRSVARKKQNVSVVESDLYDELKRADLTVTVNSNVGLESVILGTPTVVINELSPVNLDPNYAVYGSIPALHTRDEVHDFFQTMSRESLSELYDDEFAFAKQGYKLDCDAEQNMVTALSTNRNELIVCADSKLSFPDCLNKYKNNYR